MSRIHTSTKQAHSRQKDTHPDKVHFLAVLHEGPELGTELLPHAFHIMEYSQFLEGLVHLESGRSQGPQEKWRGNEN